MGLFAPQAAQYEIPEEGVAQGVCADIIDLGMVPGFEGKPTHKIQIVFQVDQLGKDGKPLQVSQRFTFSSHEKASLRKFLEAWRGKQFKDDEMSKFDLMLLIGANAMLGIVHAPGKTGGTFANINSVMPLLKGTQKLAITDYVRREKKQDATTPAATGGAGSVGKGDEDLPF